MDHDAIPTRSSDTPPTEGVFRREGEYWTLDYGGTTCRLHDTIGMRHLAHLLARPGQKVAATAMIRFAQRRWQKRSRRGTPSDGIASSSITRGSANSSRPRTRGQTTLLPTHLGAAFDTPSAIGRP